MKKYKFGTDGIRGKANVELTPDTAFELGSVLGNLIPKGERLLISKDTRESGDLLALSAISGCLSTGTDVDYINIASTPISSFATTFLNYPYALVITASHNPYYDNGLKVIKKKALKLNKIENKYIEDHLFDSFKSNEKIGRLFINKKVKNDYIENIINKNIDLSSLTIALDEANGALSNFASKVFRKLKAKVKVINNKPNGKNINLLAGSTNIYKMVDEISNKLSPFDIGFSFDGDGDRVITFFQDGTIIDGDKEALLLAKFLCQYNKKVVLTKMSDIALIKYLKDLNFELFISDVGDSNVFEFMNLNDCNIGAEKSGHIIIKDYMNSGDGLYNAIMLALLYQNNKDIFVSTIKSIKDAYRCEIEIKTDDAKKIIENSNFKLIASKFNFKDEYKFVYRASGTEPKIRILIQSTDVKEYNLIIKEVNKEIERLKEKYVWNSRNIMVKKS